MKKLYISVFFLFGLGLFFFYSFFSYEKHQRIFNSPDEMANAFFITQVYEHGLPIYEDERVNRFSGLIRPRSIHYDGNSWTPEGFIGLAVLYGYGAKIFGLDSVRYFTPMVSVVALMMFGTLLFQRLGIHSAVSGILLLAFHPAYWYYSSRGGYPNLPFFAFFLMAVCLLFLRWNSEKTLSVAYLLSGFFFALALSVRPSEAVWVVPFFVFLLVRAKALGGKNRIVFFSVAAFFIAVVFFAINGMVSGTLWGESYGNGGDGDSASLFSLRNIFFPFGIGFLDTLKYGAEYMVGFLWWYSIPAALGAVLIYRSKKIPFSLLFASFLAATYLAVYYGSWKLQESLSPDISLASSFMRYWLPIFFGMTVCAMFFLRRFGAFTRYGILIALISLSLVTTIRLDTESFLHVSERLKHYGWIRMEAEKYLQKRDIVLVEKFDKLFFPDFSVAAVEPMKSDELKELLESVPKDQGVVWATYRNPIGASEYLLQKNANHAMTLLFFSDDFYLYRIL
ncbi:MAG: glycosyltransferase family 39 protein [Parcubacteria group bacterium]|nr:glycosyltransferase family 39 protein [Parcubacteria group bacterium]